MASKFPALFLRWQRGTAIGRHFGDFAAIVDSEHVQDGRFAPVVMHGREKSHADLAFADEYFLFFDGELGAAFSEEAVVEVANGLAAVKQLGYRRRRPQPTVLGEEIGQSLGVMRVHVGE